MRFLRGGNRADPAAYKGTNEFWNDLPSHRRDDRDTGAGWFVIFVGLKVLAVDSYRRAGSASDSKFNGQEVREATLRTSVATPEIAPKPPADAPHIAP
jgi:hypothetical protein